MVETWSTVEEVGEEWLRIFLQFSGRNRIIKLSKSASSRSSSRGIASRSRRQECQGEATHAQKHEERSKVAAARKTIFI
jgi:hypothetical protein